MSNTIPGSFSTSDSSDLEEEGEDQTLAEMLEDTMDEDDSDFAPNEDDEIFLEDEDDLEADEGGNDDGVPDTRLSIAFDPSQ